jgi:subtilase family serine protease
MVLKRRGHRSSRLSSRERARVWTESLEARQLLSASNPLMHSDAIRLSPAAASTAQVDGYSPAQIRQAYGFNSVNFSNGVTADGFGQTIAIVDAYNDPKIQSDLTTFDQQFGLSAPPIFKVVNQTGGTTLPTTDAGWSGEIALDVEWAHAIAPAANILLVEANSSSLTDLMTAVDYARRAANVSVVSMSWGGSEFFSWDGTEFTGQTQYDSYFTTPADHQGVTFVAAAGDSGAVSGVQWPASSPNVLSVGGTSLYVGDQNGTYYTESSWDGTSGGFSQVEYQPAYQSNVQTSGARTTPDVAYDADPNTGFAVYDSVAYQGVSGWQVVGGTSAGAPQWAALVAIADQGRTMAAKATLDGTTQTLPALYSLYPSQTSANPTYGQYSSDFHDVIDGSGRRGGWPWRWGGFGFSNPATIGYDLSTGLGTPQAGTLIQALSTTTVSVNGATNSAGGSGTGGNAGAQQLPASQFDTQIVNTPPASVTGGHSGVVRLRITNTADTRFTGPVSIDLYAGTSSATDSTSIANDTHITQSAFSNLQVGAGKSKVVTLKYDYPTSLSSGAYFLLASLDEMGITVAPAVTTSPTTVQINAAQVDLAASFAASQPVLAKQGRMTSVVVTIQNLGNVAAIGTLGVNLYASTDGTLDMATDRLLTGLAGRAVHIAPGHSTRIRLTFQAPTNLTAGSYSLIAAINSTTQPADANAANDTAVIGTRA